MELTVGVGSSSRVDGYAAATEAAEAVKEALGSDRVELAFVVTTICYEQVVVRAAVTDTLGEVPSSGATFEGVIGQGVADESMYAVQVIGLRSDTVKFHNFLCSGVVDEPLDAGERLGLEVANLDLSGNRVLFLFPDFRVNATSFFEGIERHCETLFIGGASGDNLKFQQSFQFHNGEVFDHACTGVLMVGDFELMTIVTHGSEPLSDARVVTKCTGNVIYEIDGKPALDLCR